jgi:hypothetical protein
VVFAIFDKVSFYILTHSQYFRMVQGMEADLLAKVDASPTYRDLIIDLAQEALNKNVI